MIITPPHILHVVVRVSRWEGEPRLGESMGSKTHVDLGFRHVNRRGTSIQNETLTARHFAHSRRCRSHFERAVVVEKVFGVSVAVGVEERNGAPVTPSGGPDLPLPAIALPFRG